MRFYATIVVFQIALNRRVDQREGFNMTDQISADDKMMLEGLYWWDIPTLFRDPHSFAVWSNSPARCFEFTRFKFQMDTGDFLAEAQSTRRKG